MLSSNRKGAIAEAEIATAAVRLGIPVLRPIQEHGRYDLAFEIGGRIWRVQGKWGSRGRDAAVVRVALRSRGRRQTGAFVTPTHPAKSTFSVFIGGA